MAKLSICGGKQGMKFIKRITAKECNDGLRKYFDYATADDYWEVKGMYALEEDFCFMSLDGNVFFHYQKSTSNFTYWALEKGKMSNIRATFEVLYELVCLGYPFVRINGKNSRYHKFLEHFGNYVKVESLIPGREEYIWYIGHPDTVDKIRARIGD